MRHSDWSLLLVPSFRRVFRQFLRSRQTGEGNQKRLDFLALHTNDSGENGLQNGPASDKPVRSGPVFLSALLFSKIF